MTANSEVLKKGFDWDAIGLLFDSFDRSCYLNFHTEPNLVSKYFIATEFSFMRVPELCNATAKVG